MVKSWVVVLARHLCVQRGNPYLALCFSRQWVDWVAGAGSLVNRQRKAVGLDSLVGIGPHSLVRQIDGSMDTDEMTGTGGEC